MDNTLDRQMAELLETWKINSGYIKKSQMKNETIINSRGKKTKGA